MSLAGRIAISGSTVTVRRATKTRAKDNSTKQAWKTVCTLNVLFDIPTSDLLERIFGESPRVELRAFAPFGANIREQDGLIVTEGWKCGQRFQVAKVPDANQGMRSAHLEVGLVSTPETF